MTNPEAIKTALEDWLNTPLSADEIAFSRSDGKVTTQVSVAFYSGYKSAIDSLAVNSKDLEPEIQTLVQENFWELAGKPAVEPSEEAREFAQKMTSGYWPNLPEMHEYMSALITARDERIRREERERCAWQVDHYVSGRIVEIDDLKAAIMGGKK